MRRTGNSEVADDAGDQAGEARRVARVGDAGRRIAVVACEEFGVEVAVRPAHRSADDYIIVTDGAARIVACRDAALPAPGAAWHIATR